MPPLTSPPPRLSQHGTVFHSHMKCQRTKLGDQAADELVAVCLRNHAARSQQQAAVLRKQSANTFLRPHGCFHASGHVAVECVNYLPAALTSPTNMTTLRTEPQPISKQSAGHTCETAKFCSYETTATTSSCHEIVCIASSVTNQQLKFPHCDSINIQGLPRPLCTMYRSTYYGHG